MRGFQRRVLRARAVVAVRLGPAREPAAAIGEQAGAGGAGRARLSAEDLDRGLHGRVAAAGGPGEAVPVGLRERENQLDPERQTSPAPWTVSGGPRLWRPRVLMLSPPGLYVPGSGSGKRTASCHPGQKTRGWVPGGR